MKIIQRREAGIYARKTSRLSIRHVDGDIVAVVEIVSPGNKSSQIKFDQFVRKAADLIESDVNLLIIDLFPPMPRDPSGLHVAIWNELGEVCETIDTSKPLVAVSYDTGPDLTAYVEPLSVGDSLPEMPLFLGIDRYINVPLEATYDLTWSVFPSALKPQLTS